MLTHLLQKTEKSPADRDKIDFLLVQFFSQAAPSRLEDAQATDESVARLLAPVLGPVDLTKPAWLKPVENVLQNLQKVRSLDELLHSGVLEQGRRLKIQSGENYFLPVAMVSFTRLSFMLRRRFFHLMHDDLNAIFDGLRELESKGIQTIDCRRAQFSAEEPILRLRMICQSWKVMFQARPPQNLLRRLPPRRRLHPQSSRQLLRKSLRWQLARRRVLHRQRRPHPASLMCQPMRPRSLKSPAQNGTRILRVSSRTCLCHWMTESGPY